MAADIILKRERHDDFATLGRLYYGVLFLCFVLEDRPPLDPLVKEPGLSRIPAGRHQLKLRGYGGIHDTYRARWPWHREMIEIVVDDPTASWSDVQFHCGNTHKHTAGCPLVGNRAAIVEGNLAVSGSRDAYEAAYPMLYEVAACAGFLTVLDEVGKVSS